MVPPCLLLDRSVFFRDQPLDPNPHGGGEGAEGVVGGTTATSSEPLSLEAIHAAVGQYLRLMKPDLQIADPPGVSHLTMLRPLSTGPVPKSGRNLTSGFVAAADKYLVLLCAGNYSPGSSVHGWYLLFDAASSSISTIPGIRYTSSYRRPGNGTVIMAREGGAFVLAELLFSCGGGLPAQGMLCLWQSSGSSGQESEWVYKFGLLPDQVCETSPQKMKEARQIWRVHKSFSVQSRNLFCWVDLFHGLLLCDVERHCKVDSSDLDMSFVPLPHDCSVIRKGIRSKVNPQDFRNIACVDGSIKFITMDGLMVGGLNSLVTYTLDLDGPSPKWIKDTVLHLEDLWADHTFTSLDVLRIKPLFPILSTQEPDVVYLTIPGPLEIVEGLRFRGVRILLSVNTRKTKVVSSTRVNLPKVFFSSRYLLAVDASQWGSKYHQIAKSEKKRAVEAIETGASGKKIMRRSMLEV